MDDDIWNNCPGSSTGEDRTDRLSFEDSGDGKHITSPPFQQELQHWNLHVSQRSAFSPQNVFSATTSAQGFVENQLPINSNAHWLEHRSQPYLQGQSFQTSQPSAFSPSRELPHPGLAQAFEEYQLLDDPNGDWQEIVPEEIKEFLSSYPLQSEFTATTLSQAFLRSQLPVYSNVDSGKQRPQPFQQEPQHWSFQTSHPPTYSPQSVLSAPRFHQDFVGNQFRIDQAAFTPFQNILSSQADPDTPFASAATQQQYREYNQQQLNPQELEPQTSVLHMQSRSSTAMNSPLLLQLPSTATTAETATSIPGHSQRVSLNQLPQTSQFRIDQAEFIPSDKGLSAEATADRVLASAAPQHAYRQYNQRQTRQHQFKHQTYLKPKQFRSSTAMHSQLPTTATATETATSIASHGCQPVESSLKQQLTLEEIKLLVKKFMDKRGGEYLADVSFQLLKRFKEKLNVRFSKKTLRSWISRFKNFYICFENMCHMKSLLECFMDDYQNPQSGTDSLPSNTASNIRGLETQAPIDTTNLQFLREVNLMQNPKSDGEQITMRTSNFGTDDSLSINRPDSSTGEVKAHMMPQEKSSDSDKKRNDVGTCLHQEHQVSSTNEPYEEVQHVLNQMVPHGEVWTNERTVPSISTSNRNARHTVSYWKGVKTASQSMYSPNLWIFRQPTKAPPKEKTTLGEMLRFAGSFKTWRQIQDLRQLDVSFQLLKLYEADIGFKLISDFETFQDMYKNICDYTPVLEEWFQEIHSS